VLYLRLLLTTFVASTRARRDLVLENLALRHQLAVYSRQQSKPAIARGDRRFWTLLSRAWTGWRQPLVIVRPETVVRWHRTAWRAHWRRKSRRRGPGRPRISWELQQLITRLARENPRWGAVRIVGELRALGFEVSARTVRRYRQHALRRPPSQSWRTFLRNHLSEIWAADLFTVQTLTFRTFYVLVVIDHERRRIRHWNVTEHPNATWIWRQLIAATPWGERPRFLIRDRDSSYGGTFIARARRIGIETVLTPVRAPNANAVAERVIGTLRRECLDHVIPLGERHLRRVLSEYVEHYNAMRPHRTLALDSPAGRPPHQRRRGDRLVSGSVLGGLHHEYRWAA
jgi:putative transposase